MHANSCNTPKCELFDFDIWLLKSEFIVGHKDVAKMMANRLLGFVAKLKIIGPITFVPKAKMSFVAISPYAILCGNNLYLCNA